MNTKNHSQPQEAGAGVNATWNYTLASIVFFFVVLEGFTLLLLAEQVAAGWNPTLAVLAAFMLVTCVVQIRWSWFLRAGIGGGLPSRGWIVALMAPSVVAWACGFFAEGLSLIAAIPVWLSFSLLSCLVSRSWRWGILTLGAVFCLVPLWTREPEAWAPMLQGEIWFVLIYAALMPTMLLLSLWMWGIVKQLDDARQAAAELAVTQERLRFASDLHDIQGHHLQVIALKAELTERMLERVPEQADAQAQAAAQVQEIRLIAKQAMEETRALVAGLREVGLSEELENARDVLTLAGATCTLELAASPGDTRAEHALALAVREGTTNILRHSDATTAAISLTSDGSRCILRMTNNGVAAAAPTAVPGRAPGSGLAGLRLRLEAVGGSLVSHADPNAGTFELRAEVPLGTGQTSGIPDSVRGTAS